MEFSITAILYTKSTFVKFKRYLGIVHKLNKSKYKSEYFKIAYEKHEIDTLFDICTCKCKGICHCDRSKRIPIVEIPFVTDQRNERLMYINIRHRENTSYQSRTPKR